MTRSIATVGHWNNGSVEIKDHIIAVAEVKRTLIEVVNAIIIQRSKKKGTRTLSAALNARSYTVQIVEIVLDVLVDVSAHGSFCQYSTHERCRMMRQR